MDLEASHFQSCDLAISPLKKVHYLVFSKTPRTEDNVLVMLHGYLGTSVVFFKMFKVLMEKFYIVSVDLQGFGLSSREKRTPETVDEWIQFLTTPVIWVLRHLGIDRVNLLGHSLGGFVAAHLLKKIPDRVQRLFLLSPAGMNLAVNSEANLRSKIDKAGFFKRMLIKWGVSKVFREKKSPLQVSGFGMFRSTIVKRIYGTQRLNMTKEQQKLFISLFKGIFRQKACGDKCVGYVFHYGVDSLRPVMPILEEFHGKLPIFLYYGEFDWMDYKKTIMNLKTQDISLVPQFVSKADHQIVFQNPYETSMLVIKDYLLSKSIVQKQVERLREISHFKIKGGYLRNDMGPADSKCTANGEILESSDGHKDIANIQSSTKIGEIQNTKTDLREEEVGDRGEREFKKWRAEIDRNKYFDDVRLILRTKFKFNKIGNRNKSTDQQ